MDLATPLTYVKGVGPGRAAMLEAKGLLTVEDLLAYLPLRYEDRSNLKPISPNWRPARWRPLSPKCERLGCRASNAATWVCSKSTFTDGSGETLNGKVVPRRLLANVLVPGLRVALFGKIEFDTYAGHLQVMHPEFEILSADDEEGEAGLHTGRIVPIYEAASEDHDPGFSFVAPTSAGQSPPTRRSPSRAHPAAAQAAGPDDRGSHGPLPF